MRNSETIAEISKALAAAQGKIKDPPLSGINKAFRPHTRYAMISDIVPVVRAAFSSEGLAFWQGQDLERKCMVTRITHTSGEWIETDYAMTWSPNNTHAHGGNTTYAKRQALLMTAGIAGDEDDDGNKAQKTAEKDEKAKATKARQAKHHASWKGEQKWFMVEIGKHGWDYEDLCTKLEAGGSTRPSSWTTQERAALLGDMAAGVFK